MKKTACKAAITLVIASGFSLSLAHPNEIATSLDHMLKMVDSFVELPARDRIAAIERYYRHAFMTSTSPRRLKTMDAAALPLVFRAAEIVEAYTFSPTYIGDMRRTLDEMERRRTASAVERAAYYRALVGLRDFDAARRYLARHPGLGVEPVPEITPPDRGLKPPVVYAVSDQGGVLRPHSLDIAQGTRLIVVSHPLCAFSRRAMEAIANDAELRAMLPPTTWLAPVEQRLHLDVVSAWNRTHPATPVVLARRRDDWPMIDEWSTPQFYLVRNGGLVAKLTGWPVQGHREQLIALLEQR